MNIEFKQTAQSDFYELVELRIAAMKESLEAIGRFDRERTIERFRNNFVPEDTKTITSSLGIFTLIQGFSRWESDRWHCGK